MGTKAWIGIIFWVFLGIVTLLPAAASKPNIIGYHSLYAFAPISSFILFAIAGNAYRVALKE